jgi:hypothetical protein
MKYNYTYSVYEDGTTAVQMWTDIMEPYARLSVNLSGYGLTTDGGDYIFIPAYKLSKVIIETAQKDIIAEIIREYEIGDFGNKVLYARLRSDFKRVCSKEDEVW